MLDKKVQNLLNLIDEKIQDDSYKVIDKQDFITGLKKQKKLTEEVLEDYMKQLEKKGYIDIKYSDREVYCLAVRPKARNKDEIAIRFNKEISKLERKFVFFMVLTGIVSFIGATIAILILR